MDTELSDDTITATGLSLNEFYGYLELNLTVSNQTDTDITVGLNSADIDVPVGVGSYAYLNGFQVSATALIDVPAQSSTDDTCTFHWDDLIAAGIDEVSQIELGFDIHDQDYNHIVTRSMENMFRPMNLPKMIKGTSLLYAETIPTCRDRSTLRKSQWTVQF